MWAYLMAGIALVSAFLARDEDQRHPRAAAAQA
jgi:hypothetical protein